MTIRGNFIRIYIDAFISLIQACKALVSLDLESKSYQIVTAIYRYIISL